MRIRDLRDWQSCLTSIRQWLNYASFKAGAREAEEKLADHAWRLSEETDRVIAEGLLHTVLSLSQPAEVSAQLEQFAAELRELQPDPAAGTEGGAVAKAYRECCDALTRVQRGLPAVVEMFKAYAESRCELLKEPRHLLTEARNNLHAEPQVALRLVGEAGCLCLRGLEDVDNISPHEEKRPPQGALADWIAAVAGVVGSIEDGLEEYPLGEVALARDQWRAPDDAQRIEYKKGKLARLDIVAPEVQDLLLPLLAPSDQKLSAAKRRAIIDAGPKVVPGLIAIAGDSEMQFQCSISGGEAAIRAVLLLGDMRAATAVPTLLEILEHSDWMTIIHDQALQVLQDKMPDLAFDMALEIFDRTTNVELKSALAGILAKGGRGKPGVFERLIEFFRKEKGEQGILASYLADLGDPRALPDLHEALRRTNVWLGPGDIAEAIVELGGELSAAEEQKTRRLRARMWPEPAPAEQPGPSPVAKPEPVRATKIGRNEPCPCGSGKKFKKCCGR